jgi:hypothetical protein
VSVAERERERDVCILSQMENWFWLRGAGFLIKFQIHNLFFKVNYGRPNLHTKMTLLI